MLKSLKYYRDLYRDFSFTVVVTSPSRLFLVSTSKNLPVTWHESKTFFNAFLEVCSKSESGAQFIVSCRNLFMMPRFRSASNEVITRRPYKLGFFVHSNHKNESFRAFIDNVQCTAVSYVSLCWRGKRMPPGSLSERWSKVCM